MFLESVQLYLSNARFPFKYFVQAIEMQSCEKKDSIRQHMSVSFLIKYNLHEF